MFIPRAVSLEVVLEFILLVALLVRLSGNMNVLVDVVPVSVKQSCACSGACADVAPVSRIPVLRSFLFIILSPSAADTLLVGLVAGVAVMDNSPRVGGLFLVIRCLLLCFDWQASGDQ
jgi:hypothetical protein